jgi:hypothetical protein
MRVTWVCWCWLLWCHGTLVLSPSSQSLVCQGHQGGSSTTRCPELPAGAYARGAGRVSARWLAAVPLLPCLNLAGGFGGADGATMEELSNAIFGGGEAGHRRGSA